MVGIGCFINKLFNKESKTCVGVDWMRGKWIAGELNGKMASFKIFNTIDELCDYYRNTPEILIDIPIGLPETINEAKLRPDCEARRYLKNPARKSSVFPVPFRQLCYAESKEELWDLNEKLGSKLSMMGTGILPCIRQVDMFLQMNPEWKERLVESHPECAFQALNEGRGIENSKHTEEGVEERISILSKYVVNVKELVLSANKNKREDILDSLCLAITSKVGYRPIPEKYHSDSRGLPMRIVVANIK